MNGEEAKAVIRSQEEPTQQGLKKLLLFHSREAQTRADALRPWYSQRSRRGAATKPEALKALYDAFEWIRGGNQAPGELRYRIAFSGDVWDGWRGLVDLDGTFYFSRPAHEAVKRVRPGIAISMVYHIVLQIAEICREARVIGPVLYVPDPKHPPRHGKLADGVLARNVAEDLTAVIAQGHALDRDLAAGAPPMPALQEWRDLVQSSGAGFDMHRAVLHSLGRGIADCGSPAVPDAAILGRAHLALALEYLEELMERLPEYAEASGQGERPAPVTINGKFVAINSPVTNSHLAVGERVTSIGATIEAVADGGHTDVAVAIRALTEAIQHTPEFAEDQRAELLDHVADVADAAAAPDEPRKLNRAKAAMAMITSAAGASTQLAQAVSTCQQAIHQLF